MARCIPQSSAEIFPAWIKFVMMVFGALTHIAKWVETGQTVSTPCSGSLAHAMVSHGILQEFFAVVHGANLLDQITPTSGHPTPPKGRLFTTAGVESTHLCGELSELVEAHQLL